MLRLLLTCEHGGNQIPTAYTSLFEEKQGLLQSHRGYDPGALELLHTLGDLADKSFSATTSRLLVELNRSSNHKELFSEITAPLPEATRQEILREHYVPYRSAVEEMVHDFVMAGRRVLHISVHSFTPELDGVRREGDIGLLYDPKRKGEHEFCRTWKKLLLVYDKDLLIRFNYPYLGISDGLTTYLRRKFSDAEYMGIELEVNQRFEQADPARWQLVQQAIRSSLFQYLQLYRKYDPEEDRN